jgi:hypothetical protein
MDKIDQMVCVYEPFVVKHELLNFQLKTITLFRHDSNFKLQPIYSFHLLIFDIFLVVYDMTVNGAK